MDTRNCNTCDVVNEPVLESCQTFKDFLTQSANNGHEMRIAVNKVT